MMCGMFPAASSNTARSLSCTGLHGTHILFLKHFSEILLTTYWQCHKRRVPFLKEDIQRNVQNAYFFLLECKKMQSHEASCLHGQNNAWV